MPNTTASIIYPLNVINTSISMVDNKDWNRVRSVRDLFPEVFTIKEKQGKSSLEPFSSY